MNPDRLKELIENPESITSEHISELEELVRLYPYFQAGKVLLAKAAGTSEAIKSAAAITADRTILMRVINGTFDQDLNMPNLNDLDIDTEVNAFDHLNEDEENQELAQDQSDDNSSDELNALLNSFEEEAEKEESGIISDEYQQEPDPETGSPEDSETQLKDKGLSDFSTEDYKLPDYNYNFDAENNDEKDEAQDIKEENSVLDWSTETDTEENTFQDFDIKDLHSDVAEEKEAGISIDDDEEQDKFRNELMESLADLNRIRKENAENDKNEETSQQAELKKEATEKELIAKETVQSETKIPEVADKEEVIFREDKSKEESENKTHTESHKNKMHTDKHLINNLKETGTTSETNLMFDDNLFELNHLIDTDKKQLHVSKPEEEIHVQKEVIDRFINTIPELTAQDHERREFSHLARDLYDKSVHADTSKMTETMAKLMITQGKLPRAIEIYEHLMLKYPEKKAYFASLIEKIRKDI